MRRRLVSTVDFLTQQLQRGTTVPQGAKENRHISVEQAPHDETFVGDFVRVKTHSALNGCDATEHRKRDFPHCDGLRRWLWVPLDELLVSHFLLLKLPRGQARRKLWGAVFLFSIKLSSCHGVS